ncbi:MAG: amino acid adenylation domain-containing protein [Verrucomicrobia bacterium]|nr:amino acid adenylation domain-containing protein [Verrucomicrobiota bacterium]
MKSNSHRVATMPILSDAERHQILVEWNDTAVEYPRDKCVHQWFEEQVERTPEAVAVVFERQSLTYRELNARANQLAHRLRQLGVGPEGLVGLYSERSLNLIVGLLAVLKAGGAYLPLDPMFSRERLELMLEDADPAVLLTQTALGLHLPPTRAKVFHLDADWPSVASESPENPDSKVEPANPAYVIFTSGSTGRPKGVVVEHRNLVNYLVGVIHRLALPSGLRFATVSTFAADLGHTVLFPSLITGGQLHMIAPERASAPNQLADYFQREAIEFLKIVPSHLMALLQSAPPGRAAGCLPRRVLVLGGEASDWSLIAQVRELAPACRIFNHYGPTETTVGVLVHDLQQPAWAPLPATVPLGRPLPNTRVYVVDSQLRPVAVGVPGELLIGGAGVARGYLNAPELTAERFIPDLFSGDQAARLYRTGDRAWWLPDGTIEFLGRFDHQVKIRGYRIELGEIEAVLGGHPDLSACAVVTQKDSRGDKVLAAFVVGRKPADLSAGSLRQWLERKLPDFMVPSRFLVLPALPLTANGKLDRQALENLKGLDLAGGTPYAAPRTELERQLGEIWMTALRKDRVGINDNFFDLGGHSLLAVIICSQVTRRLGVELPVRWLFDHPTIERLARQMQSHEGLSQDTGPITKVDRQTPLPISFGQQRMWLLQQTLPDLAAYNEPRAFHLHGWVDAGRIRRALQAMVERHEVLRTALVQQGESLVQQIAAAEDVPLPWQEVDLQAVPPSEKQAALEERLLAEARRPFDLAQVPVWRVVWIKLAENEYVLGFTLHHSIEDEWTWRILCRELEQLYATDGQAGLAALPELPVQYADYAVWQQRRLTGELLERQRSYWREQLRDLPPALELPADMARPSRLSGRGAIHNFQLTGPVVTRLRELAREEETTLFTVLLAAFQVWLHRYTGRTDVVVGTPITQRDRPEIQTLFGFFLNTLPIRARLDGSPTFRQVLQQVRESLLGAFSHADLPFEQMVELVPNERAPGRQPLYQVMFVLLEEARPAFQLDQAETRPLPMETRTSKSDLALSLEAVGEAWRCQFEYATDLFTAETAKRMACHLTELLRSITDDPEQSVSQLNLMPAAERHQVLVEWNQTKLEYPRHKCVHQLFEEHVERTPAAVAVVFEGQQLTYGELNERANQLAHHLQKLAVSPEVLVGIAVERSLEMLVGLLGILKAGGAFLPMNPDDPVERLASMLEQAHVTVLLTQERLLPSLPRGSFSTFCLDRDWPSLPAPPAPPPLSAVNAENLAYVIFTSGSTGRPKGVMVSHRNVVGFLHAFQHVTRDVDGRIGTNVAPFYFDTSVEEFWSCLCFGGTVHILRPEQSTDGAIFARYLVEHGITTTYVLPAMLLEVAAQLALLGGPLPLKCLLTGLEAKKERPLQAFRDLAHNLRIINGYGPTETTYGATAFEFRQSTDPDRDVPIGVPFPGYQTYIVDARLQLLPVGVAGELVVGGIGVARGYLRQPELTERAFIADPWGPEPGARLYRTGDRCRFRSDGVIEFLGRTDRQVKLRGYRIELEEIESALRIQPGVKDAAVVMQEDGPGNKCLAAYVLAGQGQTLQPEALRRGLASRLPNYMIPAAFTLIEKLPLNANGKVDRRALVGMPGTRLAVSTTRVAPRNLIEAQLAAIWKEILGLPEVSIHDDFFELGGHSLQAIRLVAEVKKILARSLPIATLFQFPTIESMARVLSATDHETISPWTSLVPLQPKGSKPPFYFLHGWGGGVFHFRDLAHLLDADQPSYGLQAVGWDAQQPRHLCVEDMAVHYAREIRAHQPQGPYYLGGQSAGGWFAYATAQELRRQGQPVAMLAMLDTYVHSNMPLPWWAYWRAKGASLMARFLFHF